MNKTEDKLKFGFKDLFQITYLWVPFLYKFIYRKGIPYFTNREFFNKKNRELARFRSDKNLEDKLNNQLREKYIEQLINSGLVKKGIWQININEAEINQIPLNAFRPEKSHVNVNVNTINIFSRDLRNYLSLVKSIKRPNIKFIRFLNRQGFFISLSISLALVTGAFTLPSVTLMTASSIGATIPSGLASIIGSTAFSSGLGISTIIGLAGSRLHNKVLQSRESGIIRRLKDLGITPPPIVTVKDGNICYMGQKLRENFAVDLPVLFSDCPEWHISVYNPQTESFSESKKLSGAGYEAFSLGLMSLDDFKSIEDIFPNSISACELVYIIKVLNPNKDLNSIVYDVKNLELQNVEIPLSYAFKGTRGSFKRAAHKGMFAGTTKKVSVPEAIVLGLKNFFLTDKVTSEEKAEIQSGLAPFVYAISLDDLKLISKLVSEGKVFKQSQVNDIRSMMQDTDFFDRDNAGRPSKLSFQQIIKISDLPEHHSRTFKKLWTGQLSDERFSMNDVLDVTYHYNGWGRIFANIANTPLGQKLSKPQLEELAQPKNHYLLANMQSLYRAPATREICHRVIDGGQYEIFKSFVTQCGPMSGPALILAYPQNFRDTNSALACAAKIYSFLENNTENTDAISDVKDKANSIAAWIVDLARNGRSSEEASRIVFEVSEELDPEADNFTEELSHILKAKCSTPNVSSSFGISCVEGLTGTLSSYSNIIIVKRNDRQVFVDKQYLEWSEMRTPT